MEWPRTWAMGLPPPPRAPNARNAQSSTSSSHFPSRCSARQIRHTVRAPPFSVEVERWIARKRAAPRAPRMRTAAGGVPQRFVLSLTSIAHARFVDGVQRQHRRKRSPADCVMSRHSSLSSGESAAAACPGNPSAFANVETSRRMKRPRREKRADTWSIERSRASTNPNSTAPARPSAARDSRRSCNRRMPQTR